MSKKTGLTKLEQENLGNVNGGYTIEVFNDGTVEVRGIQRMTRADRRAGRIFPINVPVTRRFNNLPRAVLWASRHLLPHDRRPQPVVQIQPPFPAQDDN